MINKHFIKDAFGWGLVLWVIGYVLGIVLFMFIPTSLLGWVIMPVGIIITLLILFKQVKGNSLQYYILLGLIWAGIAIIFDYLMIVKVFAPADGYYKLDVYLYYILTFILPILVGWKKTRSFTNITK